MPPSIPDYIPQLRKGASPRPRDGGCLVQIANWLADPALWTDRAIHVHPCLVTYGIFVNDLVSDEARRHLATAAARISGTSDRAVSYCDLVDWIKTSPVPPTTITITSRDTAVRTALDEYALVDWYFRLIDEYDRLAGRNPDQVVIPGEEKWAELVAFMRTPEEKVQASLQGCVDAYAQLNTTLAKFDLFAVMEVSGNPWTDGVHLPPPTPFLSGPHS